MIEWNTITDREITQENRWEFRKSADGARWWRTVSPIGEERGRSADAFADMTDCIADAQRHGYRGA